MVFGLPDPDLDPLVTSTDPAPDPSIISKSSEKNLAFYCFCDFFVIFLSLKNDLNVPVFRIRIRIRRFFGAPGSANRIR
jgi:hypothetical protein